MYRVERLKWRAAATPATGALAHPIGLFCRCISLLPFVVSRSRSLTLSFFRQGRKGAKATI